MNRIRIIHRLNNAILIFSLQKQKVIGNEPALVLETFAAFAALCGVENASFAQTDLFALHITYPLPFITICTK